MSNPCVPFRYLVICFACSLLMCCVLRATPTLAQDARAEVKTPQDDGAGKTEIDTPAKQPPEITVLKFGDGAESLSTRQACYLLGKNLAFNMALSARGVPAERRQSMIDAASGLSKVLGIDLPAMPEITDFENFWKGRYFLMGQEGSVKELVGNKHGLECAALFELATTLAIAPTLYSPDFSDQDSAETQKAMNQTILDSLAMAGNQANFKHEQNFVETAGPFFRWVSNEQPHNDEMSKLLLSTISGIESLLKTELVEHEFLQAAEAVRAERTEGSDKTNNGEAEAPESEDATARREIKIVSYEKPDGSIGRISSRYISFQLGRNYGHLVFLKTQESTKPEYLQTQIDSIEQIETRFKFSFPDAPTQMGYEGFWAGYEHLLNGNDSVSAMIEEKFGSDCKHVFDLAVKLNVAAVLYTGEIDEDDEANENLRDSNLLIKRGIYNSCEAAFSHDEYVATVQPFVMWMHELKPQGREYARTFTKAVDEVQKLLRTEWEFQLAKEIEAERAEQSRLTEGDK